MTTPNTIGDIEHYVLVHDELSRNKFVENNTAKSENIIITNNPRGLARQRNYALNMLSENEWALFMNDDLSKIWYKSKNNKIDFSNFVQICEEIIVRYGFVKNLNLIGFSAHENEIIIKSSAAISENVFIDGRCFLIKKTQYLFDKNVGVLEDHDTTAYHLTKFGKTLRFNNIVPEFNRFTKGGFGTRGDRLQELKSDCKYLLNKYPHVFKYKEKSGFEPQTQLKFNYNLLR
jgi:hypothetical protein